MHYSFNSKLEKKTMPIKTLLLLTLLTVVPSQPTWSEDAPATPAYAAPYKAHIAFAGGGWRALNGHAGWTMSLLEDKNMDLKTAFDNVGTISSNSGGSWFNTMLSYSPSFVSAIQAEDAVTKWSQAGPDAQGWLGQQQYLFDQAPCHKASGDLFALCVAAYYTGGPVDATYWHKIVDGVVFKNNRIKGQLDGERQAWANDKALLLASSMLTAEAVVGQSDLHQQYYQACLTPSKPMFSHKEGADGSGIAKCGGAKPPAPVVTPVTFASIPEDSEYTAPPFFSATNSVKTHFDIGYSETALLTPTQIYTTLENPDRTDTVPVIVAASASSAAAGFGASKAVTGSWLESYVASDEPISFQLAGEFKHLNANGMDTKELAVKKVVQIADGGAVDNSAVSQLIGFLQQNNEANDFNVIAFDNVQQTFKPSQTKEVGVDIANLFGKGLSKNNQICSGPNGTGHCVTAPDMQIFALEALTETPITWAAIAPSNTDTVSNKLIYTKYAVTTVDNPVYGIKAGSSGTLHAFTSVWSDAPTAPNNLTEDASFKAYNNMIRFIQSGLKETNHTGISGMTYLQEALGLQ